MRNGTMPKGLRGRESGERAVAQTEGSRTEAAILRPQAFCRVLGEAARIKHIRRQDRAVPSRRIPAFRPDFPASSAPQAQTCPKRQERQIVRSQLDLGDFLP